MKYTNNLLGRRLYFPRGSLAVFWEARGLCGFLGTQSGSYGVFLLGTNLLPLSLGD